MKFVHVPYAEAVQTKSERDSRFVNWTWRRMIEKTAEEWKR